MISSQMIKTQKMDKTKKILAIPKFLYPFPLQFLTRGVWQSARRKQIEQARLAASGEVLYKHTQGPGQPAFINTFPCLSETLRSVSHSVFSGAPSLGWRCAPRSWMLSMSLGRQLCTVSRSAPSLGFTCFFTNAFIYKPFPGWNKPFAPEREIPFS